MFRKLFSKVLGKTGGAIADAVVTEALDKATGGAASKVEDAVESFKDRPKKGKPSR